MTTLLERAAALRTVLATPDVSSAESGYAEAALACASDLLSAEDPIVALELAELALGRKDPVSPNVTRALLLLRARALRLTNRIGEALDELKRLQDSTPQVAATGNFYVELRIAEASCLWRLNRVESAIQILTRVREELLGRPDSVFLANCTCELSSAFVFSGEHTKARKMCLEAIVSARRVGASHFEALALENLHRLEKAKCRWSAAAEAGEEALAIQSAAGRNMSRATISNGLAIVAWKRGRLSDARRLAGSALQVFVETRGRSFEAATRLLLGVIDLHAGNLSAAEAVFSAALSPSHPSDTSRPPLLAREYLGDMHLEQDQAAEALELFDSVLPKALALVPKGDIVAELRRRRAECYYLLGEFDRAREEALTGLKHCRELGDRYEEAATYRVLALSSAAVGRAGEAKAWFDQGFAYYEDIETPYEWGKLWLAYGDWLSGPHAGRFADAGAALEAYRAARDHFERMGAEAKLAVADLRIARLSPVRDVTSAPATSEIASEIRDKLRAPRRPRASSELERRGAWAFETFGMITRHRAVLDMLEQCAKLAAGRAPILVLGESGTGKELIAATIHKISGCAGQYMPLNCASIPAEVFESELFGHMAGSFTGATRDKVGIVEACDGGTMFLDEVGEMPVELQARVLRFLESGEFRRVGATRNTRADTRLVAATNRDRNSLKSGDGFRADLYYRLAHGIVTLPPLRQRGDDIVLLIEHFLDHACTESGKRVALADSAWVRLGAHPWPGNVRELRSALHRIVALAHDGAVIEADSIELDDSDIPTNLLEETIVVEKRRIEEALRQAGGMKSEAARILGLSRTTLLSKMKRYGMME